MDVKDISYGRIEVEAESVEEAQEKAEELYFSGMVPWADCDVSYEARPDYRAPAYYDRNGNEIKEGMRIVFEDGRTEQVYVTSDAQGRQDLGISATNEAFLKKTSQEWLQILAEHDIPSELLVHFKDVCKDQQAWDNGAFDEVEYPDGAKVAMPAPPIVFPEFERKAFSVNQGVGEDTDEVLKSIGYGDEEIAAMRANKIVR